MFCFSGSQRTGKTTLAKAVAQNLGWHYHDASTSKFAKEFGVNAVGNLGLDQRIELQEYILKRHLEEVDKAPRPAITDRCPLDMIGYMLGELTMHNTPVEFQPRISEYVHRCLQATSTHFTLAIVLRPLPHYDVDPLKPPPNLAYQTMVQLIIEGAARYALVDSATITVDDLTRRTYIACNLITDHLEFLKTEAAGQTQH